MYKLFRQRKTWCLLSLILLIGVQWSCAPTKNTAFRRAYHNVTSRYNAYFNGNESLKAGVRQLEDAHQDDYSKILEIFKYGDESQASSVFPQMDRALEKAAKVIDKHSMEFKGVEYCNWIDDSYLMIGKAYYFKQDYRLALKSFDFVSKKYNKNQIKADALLWMIKTNNKTGDYSASASLIGILSNEIKNGKASKEVKRMYPLVCADYYIKTENYSLAIEFLDKALELNKKKKHQTRLKYIQAQIYQKTEKLNKAAKLYLQVVKMNPEYDMAFHAKINMARCFEANAKDSKEIKKELYKMIKDSKNKDYLDEIYFVLAEIALKENKEEKAIDYLKLSAQKSVSNNRQKGISYYTLGEIYYAHLNYEYAEMYYDSCVQFLPQEFENYDQIKNKQEVLSSLVKNIKIIELEDSLQYLATLSDAEQNKIIDNIIQQIIEEENKKKQEEMNNFMQLSNVQTNAQNVGGNEWYFYNSSAMSFGLTEFVKKWGQRKLEDMWRLSSKQSGANFGDDIDIENKEEQDSIGEQTAEEKQDPKSRETYKKNIPKTEEDIEKSNERIVEAYHALGLIYKNSLKDIDRSIESYETLLNRFPNNKYKLEGYYQLYLLYIEKKNTTKSDYYKNLILKEFPDTDYAKLILNPNYYKEKAEESSLAEKEYQKTYEYFQQKQYSKVIQAATQSLIDYADTKTEEKFAYIKALSIGKEFGEDSLAVELLKVVQNYPKTPVDTAAQKILNLLNKEEDVSDVADISAGDTKEKPNYIFDKEEIHLFVMVINVEGIKISDVKIMFSDHNKQYFQHSKLTTSSLYIDNYRQLITVSNYDDVEKGMKYYNSIQENKLLVETIKKAKAEYFIISVSNYKIFYQNKDSKNYLDFFNKHYLK